MFHSINKNLNLQLILLLLLAGWAGWTVFTQMTVMPPDGNMLLFQYITQVWAWNETLVRVAVLLLILTMTVGIIQYYHKNHFADGRTYMPGVLLLLLLNSGRYLQLLTPALLTVFFISLIMMIYEPNEQAVKMKDRIFSFGLLIATATLLDISAFGIVLFLIWGGEGRAPESTFSTSCVGDEASSSGSSGAQAARKGRMQRVRRRARGRQRAAPSGRGGKRPTGRFVLEDARLILERPSAGRRDAKQVSIVWKRVFGARGARNQAEGAELARFLA